jgi:uncharacterized membrane protein
MILGSNSTVNPCFHGCLKAYLFFVRIAMYASVFYFAVFFFYHYDYLNPTCVMKTNSTLFSSIVHVNITSVSTTFCYRSDRSQVKLVYVSSDCISFSRNKRIQC